MSYLILNMQLIERRYLDLGVGCVFCKKNSPVRKVEKSWPIIFWANLSKSIYTTLWDLEVQCSTELKIFQTAREDKEWEIWFLNLWALKEKRRWNAIKVWQITCPEVLSWDLKKYEDRSATIQPPCLSWKVYWSQPSVTHVFCVIFTSTSLCHPQLEL